MNTINGVIEAVRKDKRGFKIGEEWYGVFSTSQLAEADRGDEVSFTYIRKGDYNNVQGPVKVVAGSKPVAAPKSDTAVSVAKTPTNLADYDRQLMIIRQNALTNAVNYTSHFEGKTATVADVIGTAQKFEQYTSGKLAALVPAYPPKAPVSSANTEEVPF